MAWRALASFVCPARPRSQALAATRKQRERPTRMMQARCSLYGFIYGVYSYRTGLRRTRNETRRNLFIKRITKRRSNKRRIKRKRLNPVKGQSESARSASARARPVARRGNCTDRAGTRTPLGQERRRVTRANKGLNRMSSFQVLVSEPDPIRPHARHACLAGPREPSRERGDGTRSPQRARRGSH